MHPPPLRERATIIRRALTVVDASVNVVRADYLTQRFAPHWHDALVIALVERGTLRTRLGARTVTVPTGSLVLVPAGEVHTGAGATSEGFSYRGLHIPGELLDTFASGEDSFEFAPTVIADVAIAGAFMRAHAQLSAEAFGQDNLLDLVRMLAGRYASARRVTRAPREPRLIAQVRTFLEAHHARVVTLAELAALTGRSAFHVSRVFREHVGLPPYAYLAQVRVQRALALLARGYSATMVAHETGFVDQSHFSRQFKRVVGMAPGHYARECGLSQLSPRGRVLLVPELASA